MNNPLSGKHAEINQTNTSMMAIVAVCSVIIVFSLMASRSLLAQRSYQDKVISKKEAALKQLKANNTAVTPLVNSYKAFVSEPENIIGGVSGGSGERDGDNAKITLDALPSKYDFPALASSLEKILSSNNLIINSITGTDDEINQQAATADSSATIDMPFEISVTGNYSSVQKLVDILQSSIRPFTVQSISFQGTDESLTMTIGAKTYYQPARNLDIKKEPVQ